MPFHCRTNQSLYTQNQTDNSIVRSCDLCSKLPEIRQERSGGGGDGDDTSPVFIMKEER